MKYTKILPKQITLHSQTPSPLLKPLPLQELSLNNFQNLPKKPKKSLSLKSQVFSLKSPIESEEEDFTINIEKVLKKIDKRRAIMVRNIPNRYNQLEFLRIIDVNFKGLYDFVYLPIDFKVYFLFYFFHL